jgi:2-polyprenyl-6-methoxyphenol hydroxylase-like FAD-dependent oxidoreductase
VLANAFARTGLGGKYQALHHLLGLASSLVVLGCPACSVPSGCPAGGTPLRLGLLPIKNPAQGRTANLITLPDHPVWNVTDGETMYQVFEQAFPQANWRELVPETVMNKFAASQGGSFPAPQYSNGLTMALAEDTPVQHHAAAGSGSTGVLKGTGVALIGDAAHCFPPDLGKQCTLASRCCCSLQINQAQLVV